MPHLIIKELRKYASPEKAAILSRFFKTGKGEYGEGDCFIGVVVPDIRGIVKKFYKSITLAETLKILKSKIHEERLLSLLILAAKFDKADNKEQAVICQAYLKHTAYINNWDLVDLSAHYILGRYLVDKDRGILYRLAKSKNIWERRVAILSTFYFIRQKDFKDAFAIADILLNDRHDLIHKAVGWMLREVGKRDQVAEEKFLKPRYKKMPRTMLRYAIEKFPENKRKAYLLGMVKASWVK
jgi:3-methyladenine DNA glycosylase AlkD